MELVPCNVQELTEAAIQAAFIQAVLQAADDWLGLAPDLASGRDTTRMITAQIARKQLEFDLQQFHARGLNYPALMLQVDGSRPYEAILEAWGTCLVGMGAEAAHQFVLFSQPVDPTDRNRTGDIRYFLMLRPCYRADLGPWQPARITNADEPQVMVLVGPSRDMTIHRICRAILPDITDIQIKAL